MDSQALIDIALFSGWVRRSVVHCGKQGWEWSSPDGQTTFSVGDRLPDRLLAEFHPQHDRAVRPRTDARRLQRPPVRRRRRPVRSRLRLTRD